MLCALCNVELLGASVRGKDGNLRHKICNALLINEERKVICDKCRTPVMFDKKDYIKIVSQTDGTKYYHTDCFTNGREKSHVQQSFPFVHDDNRRDSVLGYPCSALGESR